jgi:hypothetical protein
MKYDARSLTRSRHWGEEGVWSLLFAQIWPIIIDIVCEPTTVLCPPFPGRHALNTRQPRQSRLATGSTDRLIHRCCCPPQHHRCRQQQRPRSSSRRRRSSSSSPYAFLHHHLHHRWRCSGGRGGYGQAPSALASPGGDRLGCPRPLTTGMLLGRRRPCGVGREAGCSSARFCSWPFTAPSWGYVRMTRSMG